METKKEKNKVSQGEWQKKEIIKFIKSLDTKRDRDEINWVWQVINRSK